MGCRHIQHPQRQFHHLYAPELGLDTYFLWGASIIAGVCLDYTDKFSHGIYYYAGVEACTSHLYTHDFTALLDPVCDDSQLRNMDAK